MHIKRELQIKANVAVCLLDGVDGQLFANMLAFIAL